MISYTFFSAIQTKDGLCPCKKNLARNMNLNKESKENPDPEKARHKNWAQRNPFFASGLVLLKFEKDSLERMLNIYPRGPGGEKRLYHCSVSRG